jgi:DNA helicase-2/ATP-dependent DNA helicase PcrA
MTRAKDKLYFTWSRDAGGKRLKKISPFILESLDKIELVKETVKASPLEKIEQFAPSNTKKTKNNFSPQIVRLSQGAIDDYETCAYKYRFAHVLRLPILRHHTVVYGFALHAAVASFYTQRKAGKEVSLDQLNQVLENAWVTEGFLTAEHEERRLIQAKEVLKNFYLREIKNPFLPSEVEKEFRFNLTSADGLKVLVTGRYDRVDLEGKKVRIIDFKSVENRAEEELQKAARESIQLKVYTLAYYKNTGIVPEYIGIYDLASGLIGGYEPDKKLLEKTEEEIIAVAKNICVNLQEDSFPANPKYFGRQPACNYCAYNSICPFTLAK